jgi:hypothetical protein
VDENLPFFTRLWFAWACFFRILLDGALAARIWTVRSAGLALAPRAAALDLAEQTADTSALSLLGLLQREGRLVDFLQQEVSEFSDAEVGAVARVVHEGCRRALAQHASIVPVRTEGEGTRITLEAGFDANSAKLMGDVRGAGPYHGILRHRGWRAEKLELPRVVAGHDAHVLCPAEVEL